MNKITALVAACSLALGFAGGSINPGLPEDEQKQSAKYVAYSFVHALKSANFGKACSYYSQETIKRWSGDYATCRATFASSLTLYGFFPQPYFYDPLKVVPGSEKDESRGGRTVVSFVLSFDGSFFRLSLEPKDDGDYRITDLSAVSQGAK